MKTKVKVCVLGAGVSGLSTASVLLDLDYEVHIISKEDPRTAILNPEFSSLFPAASIIPHSVNGHGLLELFESSKRQFKKLYTENYPGLEVTRHYELFSYEKVAPDYTTEMDEFQPFQTFRDRFHPKRPTHEIVSGWRYKAYFTDWPIYFSSLIDEVTSQTNGIEIRNLKREDLLDLPFDILINCTELGSIDLFNDHSKNMIHRGHLINIPGAPKLMDNEGHTISYNYFPGKEIYQSENGNEQDIYCYSRQDGLVLGGSRQRGYLDRFGNWEGEENLNPTLSIYDQEVPLQILELNREILGHTFNHDLPPLSEMRSKMGYRYTRANERGLRLESEEINGKLVIHNYGHGGAGVTLSWGCAKKVAELLAEHEK